MIFRTVITSTVAIVMCTSACAEKATATSADESAKPAISAKAKAKIINNEGDEVGTLKLIQGPRGILIKLSAHDLPPGKHGMHFHAKGACLPVENFKEAGGHIMPKNLPHGFFHPEGPHAGNLPNLNVGADGTVEVELYTNLLMLDKGDGKILDEDGSTLMIHTNEDDHITQPIGGSGGRIACGVIEPHVVK